jgi:diguanylate cyclase
MDQLTLNPSDGRAFLPAAAAAALSVETGTILLDAQKRILEQTQALERTNERLTQRNRELEDTNIRLRWLNEELERLATTDELTGLYNRRLIEAAAQDEVSRHARYATPLALGLLDVDHFKDVNSEHTLTGGDQVLIGLARALAGSVRTTDRVGRIGGDEFMVLAPQSDLEGAGMLAERIRSTMEQTPIIYDGRQIAMTVSIGFAVMVTAGRTRYDELRHAAAEALVEAKKGRNCCVIRAV